MEILLFGHPKSKATRKAKRYFSERGVAFAERDMRKRAASAGELKRWVQRFGVDGVIDTQARAYAERGLQYMGGDPDDWIDRFVAEPLLMRLPLVRRGDLLAVGDDPEGWQRIIDAAREPG